MTASVLIADDEALIRHRCVRCWLKRGSTSCRSVGRRGLEPFQETRPDVVLLDLVLGGADGLDILQKTKQEMPDTKVVLIGRTERSIAPSTAMKLGGYDFIEKPFELEEIVAAVRNALRAGRLEQRVAYLAAQERRRSGGAAFVHAAPRDGAAPRRGGGDRQEPVPLVLVTGESGTGKQASRGCCMRGRRARRPLRRGQLRRDPGEPGGERALRPRARRLLRRRDQRKLGLVEIADGGTLFLDEIGDLGAAAQAKLLTFLEQRDLPPRRRDGRRRVDARVVAATNRDLPAAVAGARFREDLFYRLDAITVHLPPLRERRADSPAGRALPRESSRDFGRRFQAIAPEPPACWSATAGRATCASCAR